MDQLQYLQDALWYSESSQKIQPSFINIGAKEITSPPLTFHKVRTERVVSKDWRTEANLELFPLIPLPRIIRMISLSQGYLPCLYLKDNF